MKNILYWMLAGIMFLAVGCSESLLDIKNPNNPTVEGYWKNEDEARRGLNACYSFFYKEGQWMRWLSFRYDLSSDEGYSQSPWIELGDWTRFQYVNYNFMEGNWQHWEHQYVGIFRCNQVLKVVPDIPFANNKDKEELLGQAEFLRALWYFNITLLYDKGVIVLEPTGADFVPSDASAEEIFFQIETDLKSAMGRLAGREQWDDANVGRATVGACKMLLAKVYMQQGKFSEAKTELEWIIGKEGSLYGLMDEYLDNFTHLNENNKEGIFEIQHSDQNRGGTGNDAAMAHGFQRTQFYAPSPYGWQDGHARAWLIGEYKKEKNLDGKNDIRLYHNLFYKDYIADFPDESHKIYADTVWNESWRENVYIRKYSTTYYRESENYFAPNNYRLLRYSDALLMMAECIVETGGSTADAAVYVDKVRQRPSVNLAKLADSPFADALASKEAFLKRLQFERTLELCFEGWRWADLKRWGMLDTQAGIDELKSRDPDFNNFEIGKHRRLPIPQSEVDNSKIDDIPQLTQNPRY